MSSRAGRTTAPDAVLARQLQQQQQQAHKSDGAVESSMPLASAVPLLQSPPQPSPTTPASAPAPGKSLDLPQGFSLMTERQQMAYLMRATSEGEGRRASAAGNKRSMSLLSLAAERKKRSQEEADDDEEDENSEEEESDRSDKEDSSSGSESSSDEEEEEDGGSDNESESAAALTASPRPTPTPAPSTLVAPTATSSSSRSRTPAPAGGHLSHSAGLSPHDHLPRLIRQPAAYALWAPERQKRWDAIQSNPNAYYMHHLAPGIVAPANRVPGSEGWSAKERALFLWSLECYPPEGQWGLFSFNIPGRTGAECEAFFKHLLKAGVVTQTAARKNQPAKISVVRLGGKKDPTRDGSFESTPFLVTRPDAIATPAPVAAPSNGDGPAEQELAERALATAVARLCLEPAPGTEGLKAQERFLTAADLAPPSKGRKGRKDEEAEKERAKQSVPSTPSAPLKSSLRAPQSGASQTPSNVAATSLLSVPQTPVVAPTPSTPLTSGSSSRRSRAVAGSGGWASVAEVSSGGSGSAPLSGSAGSVASEANAAPEKEKRRVGASRELLSGIAHLPAEGKANTSDLMTAVSTSPAALISALTAAPTSAPATRKREAESSLLPSEPAPIEIPPSALEEARRLYPEHALPERVVSLAPSSQPASGGGAILPFASFRIPAHTPYVSAKRRKLLLSAPVLSSLTAEPAAFAEHLSRVHSTAPLPRAEAEAASSRPAAQVLPFPPARFDPSSASAAGEVHMDVDLDDPRAVVLHDDQGRVLVRSTPEGAKLLRPMPVPPSRSTGAVTMRDDEGEQEDAPALYTAELASLEQSYRLRVRRLNAHRLSQLARARFDFGLPDAHTDSDAVRALAGDSALPDSSEFGRTRPNGGVERKLALQPGRPFAAPVAQHSFAAACSAGMREYAGAAAAEQSHRLEDSECVYAHCRTFGESVLAIRASYKTLLSQLQREHSTSRDVLNSLKTAGVLQ